MLVFTPDIYFYVNLALQVSYEKQIGCTWCDYEPFLVAYYV
jgi:hypothetical protein